MAIGNTTNISDPMNPQATVSPSGIISGVQKDADPASGGGIIQSNMLPAGSAAMPYAPAQTGAATQPAAAVPDYMAQSQGLYKQYLGRDGDQEGVNYWANELKNGKSLDDVTKAFKNSANIVYQDFAGHAANTPENMAYLSSKYKPDAIDLVSKDVNSGAAVDFMRNGVVSNPTGGVTPPPAANGQPAPFNVSPNPIANGIIGTQVATYTPSLLGTPTKWDVDPNQTTQGRMAALIDPNSPYYQAWKTAGAQDAAARGFTNNSSIRDSAIMDSIIRNATPIAQSDAATFAKAAGYNADTSNNFAIKNQEAQNQAGNFNASQGNQMAQAKLSADTSKYNADKSANTSLATAQISADTQKYVSNLSSDTQKQIASLNNASQAAISKAHDDNALLLASNSDAQTAYRDYVNSVSIIQNNDKMSGQAKTDAMNVAQELYNKRINAIKTQSPNTVVAPDTNTYGYTPPSQNQSTQANKIAHMQGDGALANAVNGAIDQVNGVDVSGQLQF